MCVYGRNIPQAAALSLKLFDNFYVKIVCFGAFLPERDYVTFGSLLSQFRTYTIGLYSALAGKYHLLLSVPVQWQRQEYSFGGCSL